MNRRGVFLTFIVFFIGIIVVMLAINAVQLEKARESALPQQAALQVVNEQFEQPYYGIVDLANSGEASFFQTRVFPFRLKQVNAKTVWIETSLPFSREKVDEWIDYLNLYRIFFSHWSEEQGTQVQFQMDALQTRTWNGTQEQARLAYTIEPYCMGFSLQGGRGLERSFSIERRGNCFEESAIEEIQVTIFSDSPLTIECPVGWGSADNCIQAPIQPMASSPLLVLQGFEGTERTMNVQNYADRLESAFVSAGQAGRIRINLSATEVVRVEVNSENAVPLRIRLQVSFSKPLTAILLDGFSFSIRHPLGIERES